MHPIRIVAIGGIVALAWSGTGAGTNRYSFEVPDRLDALYEVAFDVRAAGRVGVDAKWGGGRILSFRLEAPGSPPVRIQRSGPSPQRIETTLAEGDRSIGAPWRLIIRALPGRGASQVALSIDTPDRPAPGARQPVATLAPVLIPEDDLEPWARPAPIPDGGSARLAPLFSAVERLRGAIVGANGEFASDPCSWHADFLRRVVAVRDLAATGGPALSAAEQICLARVANAVRRVDALRQSDDPLLAGPVPSDASERIVWRARRGDRIRPLEEDLDALLEDTRRGRCSTVPGDVWPARFSACLIACERYFEERVRVGDEAANAELARTEWDLYLRAAAILEAISALPGRSGPPAEPAQ